MPNITGRRPRRTTASAIAPGKLPPPQMIAIASPTGVALDAGWPTAVRSSIGITAPLIRGRFPARPHQGPPAAGADERKDPLHQGIIAEFLCDRLDALDQPSFDEKQAAIGAAQPMHLLPRGAAPAQPDHVQPDQRSGLPVGKSERDDVIARGHHDTLADADELVDRDMAAEKGVVADSDMATEHDVVGKRHVAAERTIMPD